MHGADGHAKLSPEPQRRDVALGISEPDRNDLARRELGPPVPLTWRGPVAPRSLVLPRGLRFHVARIDAAAVAARRPARTREVTVMALVVGLQARRDRFPPVLVGPAMSLPEPALHLKLSVAVRPDVAGPDPATGNGVHGDLGHEALLVRVPATAGSSHKASLAR